MVARRPAFTKQVKLRDRWCTAGWITRQLPLVDLDPCSNPHSTVKATTNLSLENEDDGLAYSWRGLTIYCNPPYSWIMPWAVKSFDASSFIFMVPVDPTTKWWRMLLRSATGVFFFDHRLKSVPPPGIKPSSSDISQCLITNRAELPDISRGQWFQPPLFPRSS